MVNVRAALGGILLVAVWWPLKGQTPCSDDSLALSVVAFTDNWGYEAYWELIPGDGLCGDGTALLWGGNAEWGCGEGIEGLQSEVLLDNATTYSTTICVESGQDFVLTHRDSYGDGGTNFAVLVNGIELAFFEGTDFGNDWSFVVDLPESEQGDVPCNAIAIDNASSIWLGSNVDATATPGEPAPPALGCGTFGGWCESGLSNSVWLVWDVPDTGGVFWISTCEDSTAFDTQLAIWSTDDCSNFDSFELINASDDIACESGPYRSGLLTPCFEGEERVFIQIDGYYGETGAIELAIEASSVDAWWIDGSAQGLSCNLGDGFNPDGAIGINSNAGISQVDWSWDGPYGFSSEQSSIQGLLPGTYVLTADYCGSTLNASFDVLEPGLLEAEALLLPDCELGLMGGAIELMDNVTAGEVLWTFDSISLEGLEVDTLPSGLCEVHIETEQGCTTQLTFLVPSIGVPAFSLGQDVFGCVGDTVMLAGPFEPNVAFEWSTGETTGELSVVMELGTSVIGLQLTDEAGCTATDALILTATDCSTHLDDTSAFDARWIVHPNPFVHQFSVPRLEHVAIESWSMTNQLGQEVPFEVLRNGQWLEFQLEVPPGMYLLHNTSLGVSQRLMRQ